LPCLRGDPTRRSNSFELTSLAFGESFRRSGAYAK
jgi:hypothetical protein